MDHLKKKDVKRSETKSMLVRDVGLFCETFQCLLNLNLNKLQNWKFSGTETDSFCVLRQSFCGKFKWSADAIE